ncbi:MAG: sugar ABC transporter substrate-binding protein [Actinobacteria bacterium]|nr:sugar ABC transporter substrate-binding protein [Actinomycetota bacterium]
MKLLLILCLATAIVLSLAILPGCKAATTETTAAATTAAAETTAATTAAAETTAAPAGAYDYYERMRESAKKGEAYPDAPATDHTLAFTNIMGGIPFCEAVWADVQKQWGLAGGDPANLYYADNQYDATIGLKNADIMLAKNPNVLINFQFDSKVNSIISVKFGAANIPIIAVDVPTPNAPFMGVNNFAVSYMAGEAAVAEVEKTGGIDKLDAIVLLQFPAGGEVLMLRSEGFYQAFVDKYGAEKVDPKVQRADGGAGEAEQANKAMTDVLSKIPNAKTIAMTSINEETMSGALAAIQTAGRWDPANWFIITMGCDDVGKQQIRDGLIDGAVAFFPEHYGEYLIPASVALMNGNVVPPFMYVENVIITKDNIDQYYPQ